MKKALLLLTTLLLATSALQAITWKEKVKEHSAWIGTTLSGTVTGLSYLISSSLKDKYRIESRYSRTDMVQEPEGTSRILGTISAVIQTTDAKKYFFYNLSSIIFCLSIPVTASCLMYSLYTLKNNRNKEALKVDPTAA